MQAAEILNVSRPHLIKLLEDSKIAYRKVGTHRRIETASLLAFKTKDDERARSAADELVQLGQEIGVDR